MDRCYTGIYSTGTLCPDGTAIIPRLRACGRSPTIPGVAVLAAILPLSQPAARLRIVPWKVSRSRDFLRQYWSTGEAALKYRMSAATINRWIRVGRLAAVRSGPRLFVDRREFAAFVKQLPKPGTKTRAKLLKHQRKMARRRLRRRASY